MVSNMGNKIIPNWMLRDKNWGPVLFLFKENRKLKTVFNSYYFDLDNEAIKIQRLFKALQMRYS